MSETSVAATALATNFPSINESLPSAMDSLEHNTSISVDMPPYQPVSAFTSQNIGNFGREAQAAYLYSKVLEIIDTKVFKTALPELVFIDNTLQTFLGSIMRCSGSTWGLYCGSIAFTIGYVLRTEPLLPYFPSAPSFHMPLPTSYFPT